jgi:hypothetical protein
LVPLRGPTKEVIAMKKGWIVLSCVLLVALLCVGIYLNGVNESLKVQNLNLAVKNAQLEKALKPSPVTAMTRPAFMPNLFPEDPDVWAVTNDFDLTWAATTPTDGGLPIQSMQLQGKSDATIARQVFDDKASSEGVLRDQLGGGRVTDLLDHRTQVMKTMAKELAAGKGAPDHRSVETEFSSIRVALDGLDVDAVVLKSVDKAIPVVESYLATCTKVEGHPDAVQQKELASLKAQRKVFADLGVKVSTK